MNQERKRRQAHRLHEQQLLNDILSMPEPPKFHLTMRSFDEFVRNDPGSNRVSQALSLTTMSLIYPGLYLGGVGAALDIETLTKEGISDILCVMNNKPHAKTLMAYKTAGIPNHLFLQIAVGDKTPIMPLFEPSRKFIHDALTNGRKVLVHCHAGKERSPTLVMYALLHYLYEHDPIARTFVKATGANVLDYVWTCIEMRRRCICPPDPYRTELKQAEVKLKVQFDDC